jgi:hypothetical protein
MSTTIIGFADVANLSAETIDTTSIQHDWSEGYGDRWDYVEAPSCPHCDTYCRHGDVDDLLSALNLDAEETEALDDLVSRIDRLEGKDWETWRCPNAECKQFGEEVDSYESAEGPMMNYYYPLPSLPGSEYDAAYTIRDLPLCIVRNLENDTMPTDYALALTGGGMDLSWEICEAFMRLGFLPPMAFADLPAIAGRGDKAKPWRESPHPGGGRPAFNPRFPRLSAANVAEWNEMLRMHQADERYKQRDRTIIAACRRTAQVYGERAYWRTAHIMRQLDMIEGVERGTGPTYILVQVNENGDVNAWPARDAEALPTMGERERIMLSVRRESIVCENQGADAWSIVDSIGDAARALGPDADDGA